MTSLRWRSRSAGLLWRLRVSARSRPGRAVPVADLGDRGHVDGVVEPPVAAPGQPGQIFRRPEETSIGAVPLQAAK